MEWKFQTFREFKGLCKRSIYKIKMVELENYKELILHIQSHTKLLLKIKYYEMEMILLKDTDKTNKSFEDIKHIDENGIEYWYARELQAVLDYKEWRKFENVIKKAINACENSGISMFEHFVGADKTIKMPKGATKNIKEYKLLVMLVI